MCYFLLTWTQCKRSTCYMLTSTKILYFWTTVGKAIWDKLQGLFLRLLHGWTVRIPRPVLLTSNFTKTMHQAKQLSTEQRISSEWEAAQGSSSRVCSSPSPAVQRAPSCKKELRKQVTNLKDIFIKPSLSFTQLLINSIAVHVLTCLTLPLVPSFSGIYWLILR